jgi:hypothetical protein
MLLAAKEEATEAMEFQILERNLLLERVPLTWQTFSW